MKNLIIAALVAAFASTTSIAAEGEGWNYGTNNWRPAFKTANVQNDAAAACKAELSAFEIRLLALEARTFGPELAYFDVNGADIPLPKG